MNHWTPQGVTDRIPEEVALLESTLSTLITLFASRSYQPIMTPTIEFFDVLSVGLSPELSRESIRFFDPHGNTLMLRSDFTVPIARAAASRLLPTTSPIKLYYHGPVFRQNWQATDGDLERYQAGIETIGDSSPDADADVIITCIEALKALGVREFGLDIGHADLLKGWSPTEIHALIEGDYVSLGRMPARGGKEIAARIPALLTIYNRLEMAGLGQYVQFSEGVYKNLDYYTGTMFNGYIKGYSKVVVSGGRYDGLIGRFGHDAPAVGFAFDVIAILENA